MTYPTIGTLFPVKNTLEGFIAGYMNRADKYIASRALPAVSTQGSRQGTLLLAAQQAMFGDFDQDLRRGPNGSYARAPGVEMTNTTYLCEEYGLEIPVDDRMSNAAEVNLKQIQAMQVSEFLKIWVENLVASLLQNTSTFTQGTTLTGGDQWTSAGSDPFRDIDVGIETLEKQGTTPTKVVFGGDAWHAFRRNDTVLSFLDTRTNRNIVENSTATDSEAMQILGEKFPNMEFMAGLSVRNTVSYGQTFSLDYIWGDYVSIYTMPESPEAVVMNPQGDMMMSNMAAAMFVEEPMVNESYRDESIRSDIFRSRLSFDPTSVNANSNYIIADTKA